MRLNLSNEACCSGTHANSWRRAFVLLVTISNGAPIQEKFGMNLRYQLIFPKNSLASFNIFGGGNSIIALIFSPFGLMECSLMV